MNPQSLVGTRPGGMVYGVLLNDQRTLKRMRPQLEQAPYKAPPVAPILYIKPRNTFAEDGAQVAIPAAPGQVRIDATVGAVIGQRATAVGAARAMDYVAGFVIVSDVTLPHDNYHRPAIPHRCRDGFCPMSQTAATDRFDPASARITVSANEHIVYEGDFSHLVRTLPQLIQDVTEFMTLDAGDVLLLGPPEGAPLVGPGTRVEIRVDGLGVLRHQIVAEGETA